MVRLEQPIGKDGASYAVALFEQDGEIERLTPRVFRLRAGERTWLVAFDAREQPVATEGFRAQARLAVIELAGKKPVRGWAVDGTLVEVMGQRLLKRGTAHTGVVGLGSR